jgi:hypothetical protein
MNGWKDFEYSAEQWDRIAACFVKLHGVDDTRRRPLEGGPTLKMLVELEAGTFCGRGFHNRREAQRQARIPNLIALRDDLDRLVRTLAITTDVNTDKMLIATKALIVELTRKIDLLREMDRLRFSAFPERAEEPAGSNAAKTGRQQFWRLLLAIWTGVGGQETGADTARFLIAASEPAFDFVRDDPDASDKDRAIPDQKSVEQWLRRRKANR